MLKYFIALSLVISLTIPVLATSTKIYVWRNEEGVLVFSDSPRAGAEEVKLKSNSTIVPSMNMETSLLDIKPKELDNSYEVVITQPINNTTIRDNTGSIFISGGIKPVFQRGFKIQLYVDGKAYKKPQTHTLFSLKNIDRGEHQLKMDLIDKEGKVIASSKLTTFYMHRASVN
ncbi:MAG: DUF4124 domain-containing protein [Colwellia sp.]|nr:DUF4124 domain-containing protein [Colwellia sp.]